MSEVVAEDIIDHDGHLQGVLSDIKHINPWELN